MCDTQEYVGLFSNHFANLQNLPEDALENTVFLQRDILLYSWLLYQRGGAVRRDDLYKYVSPSQPGQVDAAINTAFVPHQVAALDGGVVRFSDGALQAIPQAFDKCCKISQQVPFWHHGITGKQVVQFFCQMERSTIPLIQHVEDAFASLLTGFQVVRERNSLLRFGRGDESFCIYVHETDGALKIEDARKIVTSLATGGVLVSHTHVMVCSANTDDDNTNQVLRDVPLVYSVWSIELVSLFHHLKKLADEFSQQRVSQHFLKIFPAQERSFFSASHATERVRSAIRDGL